jgi:UDP-N-acetylglucosamine--N-acetylmuramyl-(pentapeptide) pyrophosphoryl-undecaprenol N-acetylglucosamine transferase
MRAIIAGGGTAGHVYPGLALAAVLKARGHTVEFAGTGHGVEASLVSAAGYPFHEVRAAPLVRELSPATVRAPFVALGAMRECRDLVRGASVVVGMGGYVSVPATLAARRVGVPIVLHEQNAVPGLANRVLARLANAVALTFPISGHGFPRRRRLAVTGNPVREEILRVAGERETLAKEARGELGLAEDRRTVLIFGGSQGALHIDRAAVGACYLLRARSDFQVVLITGPAHLRAVQRAMPEASGGLLVRPIGYQERMELAYACADLAVCRAGATTVAELTVCGLPALLIPYPHATGRHQDANARALHRTGAAAIMRDEQLSAETLAERIAGMMDDDERLRATAERSRLLGRPDAAERLADLVIEASA